MPIAFDFHCFLVSCFCCPLFFLSFFFSSLFFLSILHFGKRELTSLLAVIPFGVDLLGLFWVVSSLSLIVFSINQSLLPYHIGGTNEPAHEIMVLFVLRKLTLQTRLPNHPMGLDGLCLVGRFVYFHTLCCPVIQWG